MKLRCVSRKYGKDKEINVVGGWHRERNQGGPTLN